MSERTPWAALLANALRLGLAPNQFWRLSLKEWRALVAPAASETLSRATFDALAQLHPDKRHD